MPQPYQCIICHFMIGDKNPWAKLEESHHPPKQMRGSSNATSTTHYFHERCIPETLRTILQKIESDWFEWFESQKLLAGGK